MTSVPLPVDLFLKMLYCKVINVTFTNTQNPLPIVLLNNNSEFKSLFNIFNRKCTFCSQDHQKSPVNTRGHGEPQTVDETT